MLRYEIAEATRQGGTRPDNQDSFGVERLPDAVIAVVADGMAGYPGGDVASALAVKVLLGHATSTWGKEPVSAETGPGGAETRASASAKAESLLQGIALAHQAILEEARHRPGLEFMGTTVVCALLCPTGCLHLYAGDSRLYVLRDGAVSYRTRDHSVVQTLIEMGRMTPDDAPGHAMEGVLLSFLGGGRPWDEVQVSPAPNEGPAWLDLADGDIVVLCTDGLTSVLSDDELGRVVSASREAAALELASMLVREALDRGCTDNVSVVVARVRGSVDKPVPGAEALGPHSEVSE